MPMHVIASVDGSILRTGPTVPKLFLRETLVGAQFLDLFDFRLPRDVTAVADLVTRADKPLRLALRDKDRTGLKGQAVPLKCGRAVLIDLSFGISIVDAVRRFALTSADFGGTDLGIEMLFLVEAQRVVQQETLRFTQRLESARSNAESLAVMDETTGAHNELALELFLAELHEQSLPFALLHLDIDGFGRVNARCGYPTGDAILKAIVEVLRAPLRFEDMIARTGGDSFVIVLPGSFGERQQNDLMDRLQSALTFPIVHEGQKISVTVSVGMTQSRQTPEDTPETVLQRADAALLRAREQGSDTFSFSCVA